MAPSLVILKYNKSVSLMLQFLSALICKTKLKTGKIIGETCKTN